MTCCALHITQLRSGALVAGVGLVTFLCAGSIAVSQPPRTEEEQAEQHRVFREHARLVKEETRSAKARELQIELELDHLDPAGLPAEDWAKEWAGVYSQGFGLGGHILKIAPVSGWYFEEWTDIGVFDLNHGEIIEQMPGGVRLSLAIDPASDTKPYMSDTLLFFRWGDARCALPESRAYWLCNALNQGDVIARPGVDVLVRAGDAKKAIAGLPALPAKYAVFLHDKPVEDFITKVEDVRTIGGQVRAKVTISKGSDEGVFPQQRFQTRQNTGWADLEVIETTGQSATLVFWVSGSALADPKPPEVNQRISTHARQ
ncbi:MAG: hypothetical protein IT436_09350 [Phycisphaerales bacterium]|nr:hypothetical protein [Phycisphaerales bacterium]